ncbi:hypothetical protein C1646_778014 [Rhizophagus diaphanus]|nr:hypothetical protein C1646_778014 [Rhizophagus diaphanus] [Rhizophagus sp. MUCL 43196]
MIAAITTQFIDDFTYFAKALIDNLQIRFPHNNLYYSMRIFDPKELPLQESELSSYGVEEIKTLCEYFGNEKCGLDSATISPLIDSFECQKEWGMVKHVIKSVKEYDMIDGWHHIWNSRPHLMNVESLESHLMILLNAPNNIEDFNWDKAFDKWEKEQVRRVNRN